MRKVIVAALLVVGMTAFAQQKEGRETRRGNLTPEQKIDFQVKKLSKDLNLSDEQTKSVKDLVTKEVNKREAKRAEMKDNKEKERAQMRAEIEKEEAAVTADMKKILNPEQFAKWEKIRDERKEKFKAKMNERREKRKSKDIQESK